MTSTYRDDVAALAVGPSGSTPILQLPYPTPDDTVDVPRDVKALADKLDTELGGGGAGGGVYVTKPVLDVGMVGQIRAGRQLTLADFTSIGLAAPLGLWNLSDLTDASGNARALVNKGAVPFVAGINGLATTAAQFAGSTAQALYIADTGAADPFRIKTGSVGCWFRTAKRGIVQEVVAKSATANGYAFFMAILPANAASFAVSTDGTTSINATGFSDVCDDRWHFVVATADGSTVRLYVDGVLEATAAVGLIFASPGPLNIGGFGADGATAASNPHFGRVDEAFVTSDVLSEDQVRLLYAAKGAHNLGVVPRSTAVTVTRYRKGAVLVPGDFTTPPLRLHNFTQPAGTADEGSQNQVLAINGGVFDTAGVDGARGGSITVLGAGSLSATDAGLPAALTSRSYGCWFKIASTGGTSRVVLGWGGALLYVQGGNLTLNCDSGADSIIGPIVVDGQWHFVVSADDNAAVDGLRRKLYVDGRLVGASTVLGSLVLAGANRFRVAAAPDATLPFTGQIDSAFVAGYALTAADVARLYAKGSQALGISPKNAGDHVERIDATSVLAIFDTLDSQHVVNLGVTA